MDPGQNAIAAGLDAAAPLQGILGSDFDPRIMVSNLQRIQTNSFDGDVHRLELDPIQLPPAQFWDDDRQLVRDVLGIHGTTLEGVQGILTERC